MSEAVVAGPDPEELGAALEAEGVTVRRVNGVVDAESLDAAGIDDAELYVLTDLSEATSIPVVRELNPDVRVVVYARESLPEFVAGQAALAVDPDLLAPETVAEELARD